MRYPGIKEEYALADFEPDPALPAALGVRPGAILAVLRPPPELALYHRMENPLFEDVLRRLSADAEVDTVVLPRYPSQGVAVRALGLERVIVPEHAIDAQSLVAAADLVVSAGGTMNREAVVLGTPVYTGVRRAHGRGRRVAHPRGPAAAPGVGRRRPDRAQDVAAGGARAPRSGRLAAAGLPVGIRPTAEQSRLRRRRLARRRPPDPSL